MFPIVFLFLPAILLLGFVVGVIMFIDVVLEELFPSTCSPDVPCNRRSPLVQGENRRSGAANHETSNTSSHRPARSVTLLHT
ncbi:hypothetical protein Pr1d_34160 [Bythopirellula goksoeyrii]|uniref:Uncharacterized protein n=1 Tax=Bythopirellula goksoeyrii TaxID=1400387 RepID=A0A5B9QAS4_9BACT|nr:hypothetical protein Pr1d_34160 [Bythopirellula goksoeyrii]